MQWGHLVACALQEFAHDIGTARLQRYGGKIVDGLSFERQLSFQLFVCVKINSEHELLFCFWPQLIKDAETLLAPQQTCKFINVSTLSGANRQPFLDKFSVKSLELLRLLPGENSQVRVDLSLDVVARAHSHPV